MAPSTIDHPHSREHPEELQKIEEQPHDDDAIIHTDRYYTHLLKSLEKLDIAPKFKEYNFRDEDKRSPFMAIWKANRMRKLPKAKKDDDSSKAKEQREWARLHFICEKDAREKAMAGRVGATHTFNAPIKAKPSALEARLEKSVLDPLRHDRHQLEQLMRKADEWCAEHRPPIVERVRRPTSPEDRSRHNRLVQQRKEQLQQQANLQAMIKSLAVTIHPASEEGPPSSQRAGVRVQRWLRLWAMMGAVSVLGKMVQSVRDVKAKDRKLWKAVLRIQRAWRKKRRPKEVVQAETASALEKMKRLTNNNDHAHIFNQRTGAAALIVRFLYDTRVPACFRRMVRFVRLLQRRTRVFRLITHSRIAMLMMLWEAALVPLAFHINLVCSGRGLDLRNMSALEHSQLKIQLQGASLRVARSMATPEFHAFLRANQARVADFHRDFVAGRVWQESLPLRRLIVHRVLRAKRRAFLEELHKMDPMVYEVRRVTLDEARRLVQGTGDAVAEHLRQVRKKVDEHYEQRTGRKVTRPVLRRRSAAFILLNSAHDLLAASEAAAAAAKEAEKVKRPMLLALAMVTHKDLVEMFCELTDLHKGKATEGSAGAGAGGGTGARATSAAAAVAAAIMFTSTRSNAFTGAVDADTSDDSSPPSRRNSGVTVDQLGVFAARPASAQSPSPTVFAPPAVALSPNRPKPPPMPRRSSVSSSPAHPSRSLRSSPRG